MSERDLFEAALELSMESRAAYLDCVCGENAALRQRLEALLSKHEKARSFLEAPAANLIATTDDPISERPGTVIGPYKLMEQIGEGGMGLVFVAEQQQPIRRKVALKVIKPGMDTRQVVARFEAERQALALMDHPNIAKVLDGGTTDSGRPYFVMELVKGVPITEYCDQNQVSIRERLELFVSVCQAVQHAHQKGIIHRDIKPSNVLVMSHDGTPVVKVIDFGVAKAIGQQLTEKTIYTQFSQMVGTPLYMSPEQAGQSGLDVDTRSDIYSLGVLLYELLTGTTPFDKERMRELGYDEMRRIIREEEPPRPSTRISTMGQAATTISLQRQSEPRQLSRLFRGELDWMVMKALEKDRNRRYETASALAADVQHYLHDEPVQACPPSAWYRLRKFARRNKAGLALTGCVLTLVLGLASSGVWFAQQRAVRLAQTEQTVTRGLDQAELLLAEGDKQMEQPQRWQATARLAMAAVEKAEESLAAGMATPELADGVQHVRGAVQTAVRDSGLLVELDQIRMKQATVNVEENYFETTRAATLYAKALADYGIDMAVPEEAAARVRESRLREALLSAVEDWEGITWDRGERQQATRVLELALPPDSVWARFRMAVRQQNHTELVRLAQELPTQDLPAATIVHSARDLVILKELAAAEKLLRGGLEHKPGDFWLNHELAQFLEHQPPQRLEEAVRYMMVALALRPDSPGVYQNLGSILVAKGDVEGAIRCYQAALRISPNYAAAHNDLGKALCLRGWLDEAIAEFRAAIQIKKDIAQAHCNLGHALYRTGRPDEAIAQFREAIHIKKDYLLAHYNLGVVLRSRGQLDEAIAEYREAIRIQQDYAAAHCELGLALEAKGEFREALTVLRRGHELASKDPRLSSSSAEWLRTCERLVELDGKLPAILSGQKQPADSAERLALAQLCQLPCKQLYTAAARFYGEAFAGQPKLADNLVAAHRYNAACAAALAAAGQGKDADNLESKERARLRRQALDWLRADLVQWLKQTENGSSEVRSRAQRTLQLWQQDRDLARVRDEVALEKLPAEEQSGWRQLWAEVARTLAKLRQEINGKEKSVQKK